MYRFWIALLVLALAVLPACSGCDEGTGGENNGGGDAGNNGDEDAANNGTDGSNNCDPETAEQFCQRLGKDCGMVTAADDCGTMQTYPCGDCTDPETCGGGNEENVCGCEPDEAVVICQREMKDCGDITADDGCGTMATVNCGMCPDGGICGAETPNVCDCPCDIDGTCVPSGMANPDNPCEVCDPSRADDAWSAIPEGMACDDGLACTSGTTCNADGDCEAATIGMGNCLIDGACYMDGATDPASDCRVCSSADDNQDWTDVAQGTMCDDGQACTSNDACDGAGECVGPDIAAGTCSIDNACYNQDDLNPDNPCEVCDAASDQEGWTDAAQGTMCDDGLACTSNTTCDGGGECLGDIAMDMCAVDGVCYADGDANPNSPCETCDTANVQDDWTPATAGTMCDDGFACTSNDACNGMGNCVGDVDAGECLIQNTCYVDGEHHPTRVCAYCDAANDQNDFTFEPDGTTCDDGLACTGDGTCNPGGNCRNGDPMAGSCAIGDACFMDGDVNPANPCEICDATAEQTEWSPNTGATCDDGLACTTNDTCTANAECTGDVDAANCALDGACWVDGDLNPDNDCEVCRPGMDQTEWSEVSQGTMCDDGLGCTSGETCDGGGNCDGGTQTAGTCVADDACWMDGDVNPNNPCEICDPANDAQGWSGNDGALCDDGDQLACTGICAGTQCDPDIRGGSCVIDNACYADGDANPMNECEICDPANDTQDWSTVADLTACGPQGNNVCCNGACIVGPSCL